MIPEYEASDLEYEHSLIFFNDEVRRLQCLSNEVLVIFLNVANVLL